MYGVVAVKFVSVVVIDISEETESGAALNAGDGITSVCVAT